MSNQVKNIEITPQAHTPVLLNEVIETLAPANGGLYFDGTFGAGGYSNAILSKTGTRLISFDQDPAAASYAKDLAAKYGQRFEFINDNFANIATHTSEQFNGMVLDLGVSSMQLDDGKRGFSFTNDGNLDMRMGNQELSAFDVVNGLSEGQLADIIYKYGEEQAARSIAKKIVIERQKSTIKTTFQLADIIRPAIRNWPKKIDPATKTFQAIRIYVNNELGALENFLQATKDRLSDNGILLIVSFHSLEDSIVKSFFKENSAKKVARSKYAKREPVLESGKWLQVITKKPITPTDAEIKSNIRARSAKLRAAKRISRDRLAA